MGKSLVVFGLILVGLGVLVYVFQEILALVGAVVLVLAGLGLCANGIRVYWLARQAAKAADNPDGAYRKNVRIHGSGQD